MRFCAPHWAALRSAIDERGLSPLIAEGGEQAARNLAAEARDGRSIKNFDPLMAAHNALWARAMEKVGLELMRPNEDGSDRCPLCFLNEVHTKTCKGAPCQQWQRIVPVSLGSSGLSDGQLWRARDSWLAWHQEHPCPRRAATEIAA